MHSEQMPQLSNPVPLDPEQVIHLQKVVSQLHEHIQSLPCPDQGQVLLPVEQTHQLQQLILELQQHVQTLRPPGQQVQQLLVHPPPNQHIEPPLQLHPLLLQATPEHPIEPLQVQPLPIQPIQAQPLLLQALPEHHNLPLQVQPPLIEAPLEQAQAIKRKRAGKASWSKEQIDSLKNLVSAYKGQDDNRNVLWEDFYKINADKFPGKSAEQLKRKWYDEIHQARVTRSNELENLAEDVKKRVLCLPLMMDATTLAEEMLEELNVLQI